MVIKTKAERKKENKEKYGNGCECKGYDSCCRLLNSSSGYMDTYPVGQTSIL